jgi:hypothetical protein
MLVIRPNHVSGPIDLNGALRQWAKEEGMETFEPIGEYKGLQIEIKQVSKETYLESMAIARSAGDGPKAEVQIYQGMGLLVQHGIKSISGLEDEKGAVPVICVNGKLEDEDLSLLHDNGLTLDLWRCVKYYNEMTATEKKQFGEAQPQTLPS